MLSPTQVLPFLTHDDREVRYHAADYFIELGDRSPAETADQIWLAIDRFGQLPSRYGEKQIQHFLRALRSAPQNDASVGRAIDLLRSSQSNSENVGSLSHFFVSLPLELLDGRREDIFAVVNAKTCRILEHRLQLHEMPAEALWQMFLDHGIAAEEAEDSSKVDSEQADRMVEALAAHPEFRVKKRGQPPISTDASSAVPDKSNRDSRRFQQIKQGQPPTNQTGTAADFSVPPVSVPANGRLSLFYFPCLSFSPLFLDECCTVNSYVSGEMLRGRESFQRLPTP